MNVSSKDELPAAERLKISEIFYSLQGEAATAGFPTVFVRLTGCPLRCVYCDTEYAFYGGEWMSFDAILDRVRQFGVSRVCVTGGEPLAQKNCEALLRVLCDAGFDVSLETAGTHDVSVVDERVARVVDIKTPGSGENHRNRAENIAELRRSDLLKFVICDRTDYEWARDQVRSRHLDRVCEVLFSPSFSQQDPAQLAEWILEDRLPVRMQLQLHKQLWGEEKGR
jgi:7-carboxy-7-deazaguanine synthase